MSHTIFPIPPAEDDATPGVIAEAQREVIVRMREEVRAQTAARDAMLAAQEAGRVHTEAVNAARNAQQRLDQLLMKVAISEVD